MDDQYVGQHVGLTQLGAAARNQTLQPSKDILEIFDSRDDRPYLIRFFSDEFTSLCPKTGQPDFARFDLRYVPNKHCIESKSLKLYLFSYRNEGQFMEAITNQILTHLAGVCHPLGMVLDMSFRARGGIKTVVRAVYFASFCGPDVRRLLGV